jgi:hypothetical protein
VPEEEEEEEEEAEFTVPSTVCPVTSRIFSDTCSFFYLVIRMPLTPTFAFTFDL